MKTDACVVLVTCATLEEAERISETIVTERLAACVNVVGQNNPVRSFYTWEGLLQKEDELLLIIKTMASCLPALEQRIVELHSATVPEFIALPVFTGSQAYLQWLSESVGSGPSN